MKTRIYMRTAMLAAVAAFALMFSQCDSTEQALPDTNATVEMRGNGNNAMDLCACLTLNFPNEELSQAEIDALMFMREEEKLARDVYLNMQETWNVRVFANISNAEQRHMDAVKCLFDKYGLTDVVGTNPEGVFVNTTLQTLYNTLTEKGANSLIDAFTVGATIEDLDIYDLMDLLEDPHVDNADVRQVFTNLMLGSENHMRAFTRQLDRLNTTYTPEYISEEVYNAIIEGEFNPGSGVCGFCNGGGNGPGNGNCGNCPGGGIGTPNGPGDGTGVCPYNNPQGAKRMFYNKYGRNK